MKQKWLLLVLLPASMIVCKEAGAQRRMLQRAMEMRGSDSAWIFEPTFGRDRFFMGDEQVTPNEFYNRMRSSDREVATLLDQAQSQVIKGRILEGLGSAFTLTGWLLFDPYASNRYQARNSTALTLLIGGLAMDIAGIVILTSARQKQRQGMQIFNVKARRNELSSPGAGLYFGVGNEGVGLRLRF